MPIGAFAGSAVIGAGSSIISGNKAASAERDAAQQSADIQLYMFDTANNQQAPYREVGTSALRKLAGMYGVDVPANSFVGDPDYASYVDRNPDLAAEYGRLGSQFGTKSDYGRFHYDTYGRGEARELVTPRAAAPSGGVGEYGGFMESPGYQFRRDEGMKAIERSAASRGLLGSGGTMKAVGRYADGLASQEYENYANALRSMAGIGQTSAQTTGAQGIATGQGIAQSMTNAGNARASSFANTGAAINNGVSNIMGAYLQGGFGGRTPSPYGGNLGGVY